MSSLNSAHTSPMKQEGKLGHMSQSFPSSTLATRIASPDSVISKNSTDSGYMSSFDLTSASWSPINTPDLDASTSPSLSEDFMPKFWGMPLTKDHLRWDEVTISGAAYSVDEFNLDIGSVEGCLPSTMYVPRLVLSPIIGLTGQCLGPACHFTGN